MEHRIGNRMAVNLEVDIYLAEKHLGNFSIRDIGASGLSVEDPHNRLQADRFLQLVMSPHRHSSFPELNMNALVVWVHNRRAGLMWANESLSFSNLLRQISSQAA